MINMTNMINISTFPHGVLSIFLKDTVEQEKKVNRVLGPNLFFCIFWGGGGSP